MASDNFPDLPPFPDDIPTTPLLRLSLATLLKHEEGEYQRFCKACEEIGFFYLDLRELEDGQSILSDADQLFKLSEDLFALDIEEKMKYDFSGQKSYFGYKPLGATIIDRKGNIDRNEFYNIARMDLLGVMDPLPQPDVIAKKRPALESFVLNAHSIVTVVLNLLNEHLKLPPSTLTNMHRIDHKSGDQVRLIKAPAQPTSDDSLRLTEHTDFGSVTVLFNRVGGLQVLPPGGDAEWSYVKPLPGHCIVNLGDSLVKFTNGLLRSNIHRVISSPGAQADLTRYSVVYFSRPEDDVVLKRLEGSSVIPPLPPGVVEDEVNSKDWVSRRALALRVNLHKDINFDSYQGTEQTSRRIKV